MQWPTGPKANSFHTVESLRRRTSWCCCCSQPVSRMLATVLEWLTDFLTGAIMESRKAARSKAVASPPGQNNYIFNTSKKKTGTVQGKYQPDGILGYIGDDYILEPIGGKTAINFSVPENSHGTQEFVPGKSLRCYWNRIEAECFISTIPWISTEPLKRAVSIWNSLAEWL